MAAFFALAASQRKTNKAAQFRNLIRLWVPEQLKYYSWSASVNPPMESIYRWSLLYWWSVTGLFGLFSSATVVPLFMRKRVVKCYWTIKSCWHITVSLKDRKTHSHTHKQGSSVLSSPRCDEMGRGVGVVCRLLGRTSKIHPFKTWWFKAPNKHNLSF